MMRRREFITLLAGAAAAWPLAVRAQDNGRTYRLGFLLPSSRHGVVDAFFDELRLNGFVEGKNLVVMPGGFEAVDDNLAERAAGRQSNRDQFSLDRIGGEAAGTAVRNR